MTKKELLLGLESGKTLCDMLDFGPGQECEIFKAKTFVPGDEVIYVPDIWLNDIPINEKITDKVQMTEALSFCYTGNDFIKQCGGNVELARRLFSYVDWQHPSSAYDEGAVDED